MDVVWRSSLDELHSRINELSKARQLLIEAEAQGHTAHEAQSTTGDDDQLAGVVDGAEPSYFRHSSAPTTERPYINVDALHQTDDDDEPLPMVTEQDAEDFYPLDAPFAMEEEQDAMQLGGRADLLADAELWNDDDDVGEDIHQAVAIGRMCVPDIQTSDSIVFGQAHRNYISVRSPSSASHTTGASPPEAPHNSGLHDTNAVVLDHDDFNPVEEPFDDDLDNTFHWGNRWYHQVYNSHGQQIQSDDIFGHLPATEIYNSHGDTLQDFDLLSDDDEIEEEYLHRATLAGRLHIPHIEDTPVMFNEAHPNGGFGGVPASAAAIASLKKQKYDGLGVGGDSGCVICMEDFRNGKKLLVMPCKYMHRFHGKCLKKWLSCSRLCPLCRYAMPTEEQNEQKNAQLLYLLKLFVELLRKGKKLLVMPCKYMHRFHGKCLKKWLSCSRLCPLCRYAMPTEEQNEQKSERQETPCNAVQERQETPCNAVQVHA
ncbi:hypothetical protein EJB05_29508, partial [Eragrostis curvula]